MFGREFSKNFVHDSSSLTLNHGASGSACKPAFEAQLASLKSKAAFPDMHYYRLRSHTDLRLEERTSIAKVLDANVEDIVLCQGATTGINAILRSFPWAKGDKVLVMSTIFHNCQHTLEFVVAQFGIELVEHKLQYPISDAQLVQDFTASLDKYRPRMALFDVVSSTPSIYFPWEDMCKACNDRDIASLVDGAHGIGLVPVSLRTAKPSFWVSNIHKWFWVSQSAGVIYVDPKFQQGIQSLPISMISPNDSGSDRFIRSFSYSSTLDYTVLDSIPAAAAFRESFGEDKILAYQTQLAEQAIQLVCSKWKTSEINPLARRQAMFTIECPVQPKPENQTRFCKYMIDRLRTKYRMFLPVFKYENKVWVRFCASVYVELADFEAGLQVLEECFNAAKNDLLVNS